MTELHDRFLRWVQDGSRDELPRDLALHASGCRVCLARATAMDALLAVDAGQAPMPPRQVVATRRRRPAVVIPAIASSAAVLAVVVAGAIVGSTLFRAPETSVPLAASGSPPARGAVLGDQGGRVTDMHTPSPDATKVATPTASATPFKAASDAPASDAPASDAPAPTMGGGPPPVGSQPPAPAPTPPAEPTAPPATPTAAPTPPPPSPADTPRPTACPLLLCPLPTPAP